MKKGTHKKPSNLWTEICKLSLVDWLIGCGWFLGLPFISWMLDLIWKQPHSYGIFAKIFFTALLTIIGILYFAAALSLSKKEKEERERSSSIEDYYTYKKIMGWRVDSYETYVVNASNQYIGSFFGKNMNDGISCSIMDFIAKNDVNSLYTLKLFYRYIKHNWTEYEGREISFDCFLLPFGKLSMTPFRKKDKFRRNYDKNFLICFQQAEPALYNEYKHLYEELSISLQGTFSNSDFDISFECAEPTDYEKFVGENEPPVFVKVIGNLTIDKQSNKFTICNCRFKKQEYDGYLLGIKEKMQIIYITAHHPEIQL